MNIGIQHLNSIDDLPQELNDGKYILDGKRMFSPDKSENETILYNVNFINFFIGANNSGKSRFLRGIFKTPVNKYELFRDKATISGQFSQLSLIKNNLLSVLNHQTDREEFQNFLVENNLNGTTHTFITKKINELDDQKITTLKSIFQRIDRRGLHQSQTNFEDFINKLKTLLQDTEFHQKHSIRNKKYIPALRYGNTNNFLNSKAYAGTIKENYSISNV